MTAHRGFDLFAGGSLVNTGGLSGNFSIRGNTSAENIIFSNWIDELLDNDAVSEAFSLFVGEVSVRAIPVNGEFPEYEGTAPDAAAYSITGFKAGDGYFTIGDVARARPAGSDFQTDKIVVHVNLVSTTDYLSTSGASYPIPSRQITFIHELTHALNFTFLNSEYTPEPGAAGSSTYEEQISIFFANFVYQEVSGATSERVGHITPTDGVDYGASLSSVAYLQDARLQHYGFENGDFSPTFSYADGGTLQKTYFKGDLNQQGADKIEIYYKSTNLSSPVVKKILENSAIETLDAIEYLNTKLGEIEQKTGRVWAFEQTALSVLSGERMRTNAVDYEGPRPDDDGFIVNQARVAQEGHDEKTLLIGSAGWSGVASLATNSSANAKDRLIGGDSNDILISFSKSAGNFLSGGQGHDVLIGSDYQDTLDGGDEDDAVLGGGGNDVIKGGYGRDALLGGDGIDILEGGYGNDRLDGGAGNDKGSGEIDGGLYGGFGDDLLVAELNDGDDFLDGGTKAFSIGSDGTDTVVYKFAQGNSTIEITEGTGDDGQTPGDFGIAISGARDASGNTGTFGNDTLTSIEKAAVEAGSDDDSLILTGQSYFGSIHYIDLGAGTDTLDAFNLTTNITLDLREAAKQSIEINDGFLFDTTVALKNIENAVGTQFSDVMYAAASGSLLSGAGGNDELRGGGGNDTLLGGAHNDELWGGDGADTLDGGSGADILVVDQYDTIARGDVADKLYWKSYYDGLSFNNRFTGGSRVVKVYDEQTREEQIQAMLNSPAPFFGGMGEKYEVVGGGLRITMKSGEVVNLAEWTEGEYGIYLETRKDRIPTRSIFDLGIAGYPGTTFAIGPVLTMVINLVMFGYETFFDPNWSGFATDTFSITMLEQMAGTPGAPPQGSAIQGTAAGQPINGRPGDDRILAGGGDDTAHGSAGDDFVDGGDGSDTLYGDVGADRLEGGAGDDVLEGGVGNDTIVTGAGKDTVIFRAGDGADTIIADAQDVIKLEGIKSTDVVARSGGAGGSPAYGSIGTGSLSFAFGADRITIDGANFGSIEFADGVVKTATVLARDAIAAATSSGNDVITGFGTADRLAGGTGNDYLNGLGGNDAYYFASGDGQDRVEDSSGLADRVVFGAGITAEDLVVSTSQIVGGPRAGEILVRLAISGTADWVEFVARDIEEVRFADGTNWDKSQIASRAYQSLGTAGDDRIDVSNWFIGTFRPGAGDDRILVDARGSASLQFGHGSDLDRVELRNEDDVFGPRALITLDGDVSLGDLFVQRYGDGLAIGIAGSDDRLEITRAYDSSVQADWRLNDVAIYSSGMTLNGTAIGSIADAAGGVAQRLTGTTSSDTLYGGASNDWISGGADADVLSGNAGTDLLFGGAGDDILNGEDDRDLLFGEAGNDEISGGEGNDSLYAGTGLDTLLGGGGNDELFGNGGDTLNGGAGNDRVTSGRGDTIVYNLGDGSDTIIQDDAGNTLDGSTSVERTEISLGTGIDPNLTTLTLEGWSVYININGSTSERIRLDRQFQSANLPQIRFSNGTIWQETEIFGRLFTPNNGNDTPAGIASVEPQFGNQTIGYVYGGGGNDTLRDTNLSSVAEINYVFTLGGGTDVINSSIRTGKLFLQGFDPDQLTITRSGTGLGDLTLSFSGSSDTVKINGQARSDGGSQISDFYFSGARLFASDIRKLFIAQSTTNGNDTITGFDGPGGVSDVGIVPGVTYTQKPGNDRIEGGLGNDLMVGGSGDDTYIVSIGDGIDTIRDVSLFNASSNAGYDVLITNALSGDTQFRRSSLDANDLVISFSNSSDQIIIDEFFAVGAIEEFQFGDGIILSAIDVQQLALTGSITSGNDVIKGSAAPETLNGGAGSDTLDGLAGADRYVFNIGDGQDVVTDTGTTESNILAFGEGIAAASVTFQKVGNNLKALLASGDSITISNQFSAATRPIGYTVFANGARLSAVEIDQLVLADQATSGNDSITGFVSDDVIGGADGDDVLNGGAGNDIINGGTGNDTLNGQQGSDVYLIARADGADVIASSGDSVVADIVRFAGDIDQRDVKFVRATPTSPDLVVALRGSAQTITISNYFAGLAIKQFEFSDGTILGSSDVTAALANAAPTATGSNWRMAVREGVSNRVVVPDGLFADDMPVGELVYSAVMGDGSPLPSWLQFDGRVFQSAADDAQVGTHSVQIIATDRFGESVTRTIALDVLNSSESPTATAALTTQHAPLSAAFSYALPGGLFADDDQLFAAAPAVAAGTYVSERGGSFIVLSDGSYSYTPAASYIGEDRVYLPYTIGTAQSLELAFEFESTGVVSAGTVPTDLAPDQDSLTLTARLANGDPLPTWLSFDGANFSGTPAASDEGPLALEVVATDADGRQAVIPFAIRIGTANGVPLAGALPPLAAAQGEEFSYTLAASLFTDPDVRDRLALSATLADGSPLPSWLVFDGESFFGKPANGDVGAISVRVTATDIAGATASVVTTLTIANANDAPVAGTQIANQLATQNAPFNFAVPGGSFADPDLGDTLTMTATLDTGEPLPAWLNFAGGVFTGTPANADTGLIRVQVTATDAGGKTASQHFLLGISDVNDAPTVAETLAALDAPVEDVTVFRIPSSLFADSDDVGYRLSVSLADGSPLPNWITFDPNFETITFRPLEDHLFGKDAAAAQIGVRITATDTRGESVSTILAANIAPPEVSSTLYGSGSNTITGTNSSERIDSGPGNNLIRGGGGVDRIVFGIGSGQDTIERGSGSGPFPLGDIVEFGPGITLSSLTFTQYLSFGTHLRVQINGTNDKLEIKGQFNGRDGEEPTVREFRFADGSTLSAAQIVQMLTQATPNGDLLIGGNQQDVLNGSAGNDTIYGLDGDDLIDGGQGNDILIGDSDSNSDGGSDTFLFGTGSGNDIIFADSYASLTLNDETGQVFQPQTGIDTLRFGPGITPDDLIITHIPGYPGEYMDLAGQSAGSMRIEIAGTSDSVTIDHQFYLRHLFQGGVNTPGIERFEFADGTVMNRAEFEALITLAPTTVGDDLIAGGAAADTLAGGLGNDILVGEDGADTYIYNPGDGADRIIETMQVARPTPAANPTEMAGDIISFDALSFGAGIDPDDLIFTRPDAAGETLVITFRNQPGSVTIENQFRNIFHGGDIYSSLGVYNYYGTENAAIDEFRFANGTRWSLKDIYAYSVRATAGDDVIDGFFRASETLNGGAGNDLLVGRNGNDTYEFGRGYGNDSIKEFGWFYSDGVSTGATYTASDKIRFLGVASTDVTTHIGAGGAFVFTIIDTGETLTILPESEMSNFGQIFFSDTTWSAAQFQARWTIAAATSGNDVINGFIGNDTINGGDGNDILQGGQNSATPTLGYDTLNGGNGNDILTLESSDNDRANGDDGDDIFRFDMTLPYWSSSNLAKVDPNRGRLDYPTFVKFGTERGVIEGGAGNDTLILGGKLADYWGGDAYVNGDAVNGYNFDSGLFVRGIETIQFADGTVSMTTLAAATSQIRPGPIEGTLGNDVLNATSGHDALYGRDGNDTLNGLDGDDWLIGGTGTDSYNGGNGFDIAEFSYDLVGWNINLATGQAIQGGVTEALSSIEGAYGSAAADTITGSTGANILAGGGGNDTISAGDGDDIIELEFGDSGFDAVDGGAGSDTIRALADDVAIGLSSIANVETITANGHSGVYISGSAGIDTLNFSSTALIGIDRIDGGDGNDNITGSVAGDTIYGRVGDDILNGGDGNDVFRVEGTGDGFDAVTGGAGNDSILADYSSTRIGLTSVSGVELISGEGYSGVYISGSSTANVLDFTNVELRFITRIDGGSGNDIIYGSAAADVLQGSAGDDSLFGGIGNDTFQYSGSSNGFDAVDGGVGINGIIALANSTVIGLTSVANVQTISAGAFTGVSILGSGNADTLNFAGVTLNGITKIDGGSGNDNITGSAANDTILGSGGDDSLAGGDGNDIFQYTGASSGFDSVNGGLGTDTIVALANSSVIGLTSLTSVETISSGGFTGVTIAGSGAADTLDFSNVTLNGIVSIGGGAGNDVITGSISADLILGGNDNDTLNGGDGDDVINGGTGTNLLNGGNGTDAAQYSGTAGSYSVSDNGDGTYALVGAGISDTLASIENLAFSDGTVTVASRVGLGLTLTGTASAETLTGGGNADIITGLGGDDILSGNGGDDEFRYSGSSNGFDNVDGGSGTDTIKATANTTVIGLSALTGIEAITSGGFTGVSILGSTTANALDFSAATLTGITKIDGGSGNDTITGSSAADTILGSGGDDILSGGDGNDTFQFTGSSNGFDAINGGLGSDTITALASSTVIGLSSVIGIETISSGGFSTVSIAGSANADTLDFSATTLTGITRIDGGLGNDAITGSGAADTILGSGGDDVINAGGGNDTIQFTGTANGFDAIDGGLGTDTISALANSTVIGLSLVTGIETISAGSFTGVYIAGSGNADTLNFSAVTLTNITRVEGGGGADVITGNAAANTIWGGLGNDILDGGTGNDSLLGDDGDDIIKGAAGTDTMNGGNGIDTADYSAYTANVTVNLATTTAQTVATSDSDTITNIENVKGGSGTDTLTGSTANNVIDGGSGNDRLRGAAGNDTIIGGIGTADVAIFAGTQASHTIATNAGVVTITDNQTATDGNDGVDTVIGIEIAEFKSGVQVGITSPIVLDLNGDGVSLINNRDTRVSFDWDGDGLRNQTGWVGRDDGFLVFDRDGNGLVSNGGELTFTGDRPGAKSDLDGLRAFDSNGDGQFSSDDEKFSEFHVWRDANANGRSDAGEMLSLEDAGVAAINLTGEAVNRSWNWGDNMTINNGSYTRTDGTTAAFGDVALNYDVSPRRAARPFLVHERVPHRAGGVPFVDRAAMQLGEAIAGFVNSRQLGDLRFDEAVIAQQELFMPVPRIM